jgi:ZIP family zinc transporter
MTTAGAAIVFFFKKGDISPKLNTIILGLASGIMIASAIWSLILPAIELSANWGKLNFLPATVGFLVGGLFLIFVDKVVGHFSVATKEVEGVPRGNVNTKLFVAVTIHNIPEGLAVGFAFGAAALIGTPAAFVSALGLAIGIGIQNFPEGAAVALPLIPVVGRKKAFLQGMASGSVEPVFAVVGYFLAKYIEVLQPWLLAFSAGAMFFVVADDLLPDSKNQDHPHLGTWAVMIGFLLMMVLDVAT